MSTTLATDVRFVSGPAGGALYDLRDGRVHPVAPAFAELLRRHLGAPHGGGPSLDELAASPAEQAWVDHLAASGLAAPAGEPAPWTPLVAEQRTSPKLIWLEITGRCNWRCVHCYAEADPSPDHPTLPDERWFELIREARAAGFPALQFIGGDPFMHPRIMDFLAAAHGEGFEVVEVYTNGSMLRTDTLDRFAAWGTHVALSFYSHRPEVAEAITQTPGGHARTVRAIEGMVARGIPLRIGIIEMDENRDDLDGAIEFLVGLGVARNRIDVDGVRPSGRGAELVPTGCGTHQQSGEAAGAAVVSLDRLAATAPGAAATAVAPEPARPPVWRAPMPIPRGFKLSADGAGAAWNTCWPGELVVDPEGDIFPCIFAREHALANVATTPLAGALGSNGLAAAWDTNLGDAADCEVCEFRYACFDCRALTENMTGDRHAKPPSCIYDPHTGRFDWPRWLGQQEELDSFAALAVEGPGELEVLAEDAGGITVAAPDRSWVAVVEPAAAALLDLADGRSVGDLAGTFAGLRDEDPGAWLPRILTLAWELEARGLVCLRP